MNEGWQSVLLRVGDISKVLQPLPSAKMALCSNSTVAVFLLFAVFLLHSACKA